MSDHDSCLNSMDSGSSAYNNTFWNNNITTIFDCRCEADFYKCLKMVDTDYADNLGTMYFAMQKSCYMDFPSPAPACFKDPRGSTSYQVIRVNTMLHTRCFFYIVPDLIDGLPMKRHLFDNNLYRSNANYTLKFKFQSGYEWQIP